MKLKKYYKTMRISHYKNFIDVRFFSFILIFFLLSLKISAQKNELPVFPIDSITNKITYSEIVYLDSSSNKQDLFLRAREWFAKTFNSSNHVIQMQDKIDGILIGKGSFEVFITSLGMKNGGNFFNFTLSVYLKDGRYKYEFTDFTYTNNSVFKNTPAEYLLNPDKKDWHLTKKANIEVFNQLDTRMTLIISDLKIAMKKPSANQNIDW